MSEWDPAPYLDKLGHGYCDPGCPQATWHEGSRTARCELMHRTCYREYKHVTVAHMCEPWAVPELMTLRAKVDRLKREAEHGCAILDDRAATIRRAHDLLWAVLAIEGSVSLVPRAERQRVMDRIREEVDITAEITR